jgi:hypothetical protein
MELGPMLVMRLQRVKESGVSSLGVAVVVKQQGGGRGAPRLQMIVSTKFSSDVKVFTYSVVCNAPAGDADAVGNVQARVLGLDVVGGGCTGDVELGNGALGGSATEGLHGVLDIIGTGPAAAVGKVHLGTDAVDGDAGGAPLLDVLDQTGDLAVVGDVKVVVVDVQLASWVNRASSLEGNADVVLADDLEPVAVPEGSVFVEDFVDNVLVSLASFIWTF